MTSKIHGTSSARQEPLYDPEIPTPTHAEYARSLVVGKHSGTICTLSQSLSGYPHGSLVTLAWDEGRPTFLISELAEHTKNLRADPRCSLMIAESDGTNPLALGRLTALGKASVVSEGDALEKAKAAYLAVHPDAQYYCDYSDFNFWQIQIEKVRYIGGFGRMSWFEGKDWMQATPDPLIDSVSGIVEHMNEDHHDAMLAYCHAFTRATQAKEVKMTGVDRYGFEMSVNTQEGWRPLRLAFKEPCQDATQVRQALVAMVKEAREKLGHS